MITNLSAEYPALLDAILFIFAGTGTILSGSAVLAIIKLGRRDSNIATPAAHIGWKLLGGASLVDLSIWANAWCGTLWSESDPMGISAYTGSGGNYDAAIMAAVGIMVLAGWITLGRAYIMVTKIGSTSVEARGDLIGSILARIVAGTALICTVHIAGAIQASTGFGLLSS